MIYRRSKVAAWALKYIVNGCILALLVGIGGLFLPALKRRGFLAPSL